MNDFNITKNILGYIEPNYWANIDAIITIISILIIIPIAEKLLNVRELIKLIKFKFTKNYIIVCGLGENNRIYIDSEIRYSKVNIIIIEQNKNNPYIEEYKRLGLSVIIGDATNKQLLQTLNIENSKYILISVENNMLNLKITAQILELDEDHKIKIYLNLENRSLRYLHKENNLLRNNNIKIYSYYEEASRELFDKFDIDGQSDKIINSNDNFSIAIIGNTNLAYEVISQACIMGQLPNENMFTIYCIDNDVKKFQQTVELNYTQIDNIPNISMKYICLDINSKDFYENNLWEDNLTNIILCFEDDQINLDIAYNLANITYLDVIADNKLNTNIILAMFNEYSLSTTIKNNNQSFGNFSIFANAKDICDRRYLINEERDKRAIAINELYRQKNQKDAKEWQELTYFEKESNRASADHIKIKKKYLKINANDKAKELLAKCEHNRWNTYHFLNGYRLDRIKNHHKKLHPCLVEYTKLTKEYKEYDREMVSIIDDIERLEKNIHKEI